MIILYSLLKNFCAILAHILYKVEVEGLENIPKDGALIICSNHIHAFDPVMLAIAAKRKIRFMAKKELFKNPILRFLLTKIGTFPVDRQKADLASVREAINVLKGQEVLGIFPEGTRVKTIDLSNLKEGIGFIASKGNSDIVPAFIEGEYKFRSRIKISFRKKVNIEDFSEYKSKEKIHAIVKEVYSQIYNLEG